VLDSITLFLASLIVRWYGRNLSETGSREKSEYVATCLSLDEKTREWWVWFLHQESLRKRRSGR
jgi:hypothetical protein